MAHVHEHGLVNKLSLTSEGPEIERIALARLRPWTRNARTHSRKQLRQIADSITRFGFTNPVLIDGENRILAGHGRVEAAKLIGMTEVPCLRFDHMSASEKRAYVLADNKLALNAGWDEELLAQELKELSEADLDFSLDITGFSIAELDSLIEELAPEEAGDPAEDALPNPATTPRRCKPGDIYRLGPHRLICGDALDARTVEALMDGETAEMAFTDPPYNVRIDGNVSGLGKVRHEEFAMASGEMSPQEFTAFLSRAFANLAAHSGDGSVHFICMDWRHMGEMLEAGGANYAELKNLIVWVKDNGGMGSFYRSRHELVFAFKKGAATHINSFELGQHGRYRTNVWEYRGANSRGAGRMEELAMHPTVKPVGMIADAIKDVSRRNGVVLDLFGGSGSTLIAAHKTGRRARVCELDPVYCDRILARWEKFAKDDAELTACGIGSAAIIGQEGSSSDSERGQSPCLAMGAVDQSSLNRDELERGVQNAAPRE
ncbi:MAG: ParB N-terminal domain-containing protein [Pseudomonadota bacterium]|nr:ParB N-terminal domain-containing protein [Pseudomonadota bacterium]